MTTPNLSGNPEYKAWRRAFPRDAKWIAADTATPTEEFTKLEDVAKAFKDRTWDYVAFGGTVQVRFGSAGTTVTNQTNGVPMAAGQGDTVYVAPHEADDFGVAVHGEAGSFLVIWPSSS